MMIRSEGEIDKMIEKFKKNPNDVFRMLTGMSHEGLAIFTMQLLSLKAAPTTGPASSSVAHPTVAGNSTKASELLLRAALLLPADGGKQQQHSHGMGSSYSSGLDQSNANKRSAFLSSYDCFGGDDEVLSVAVPNLVVTPDGKQAAVVPAEGGVSSHVASTPEYLVQPAFMSHVAAAAVNPNHALSHMNVPHAVTTAGGVASGPTTENMVLPLAPTAITAQIPSPPRLPRSPSSNPTFGFEARATPIPTFNCAPQQPAALLNPFHNAELIKEMSTHDLQETLHAAQSSATNALPANPTFTVAAFRPIKIPLKDIYFYQDYVCNQFMDGRFLSRTIEQLRSGEETPETLPPIEAICYKGKWYGMGNRRLACYRYVFRDEPTRLITCKGMTVSDDDYFFPQGTSDRVRLGGGLMLDGQFAFTLCHCLAKEY